MHFKKYSYLKYNFISLFANFSQSYGSKNNNINKHERSMRKHHTLPSPMVSTLHQPVPTPHWITAFKFLQIIPDFLKEHTNKYNSYSSPGLL